MRLIGCPEMLVYNYQRALHNVPEEHRSQLNIAIFCQKSAGQDHTIKTC
jgi:hypothetical protein